MELKFTNLIGEPCDEIPRQYEDAIKNINEFLFEELKPRNGKVSKVVVTIEFHDFD